VFKDLGIPPPVELPIPAGEEEVEQELDRIHAQPRHQEGDAHQDVNGGELAQLQHRPLTPHACRAALGPRLYTLVPTGGGCPYGNAGDAAGPYHIPGPARGDVIVERGGGREGRLSK
jgi:hypothetical protein